MATDMDTLIVVDLEATCCDRNSFPRDEMEIIEIGAVAADPATGEFHEEFQAFVQPVRHPQLTEFCTTLTTITQDVVTKAPTFPEVHGRFVAWIAQFKFPIFCSWGDYDRNQIHQDCRHHGVPYPFSNDHRNLKKEFSEAQGTGKRYGLGAALRRLGLDFQGTAHRGIDDAKNIAQIYASALAPRKRD